MTRLASHFLGTILKRQLVCAVVPLLLSSFRLPAAWDIGAAILGHEEGDHPLGILEQWKGLASVLEMLEVPCLGPLRVNFM